MNRLDRRTTLRLLLGASMLPATTGLPLRAFAQAPAAGPFTLPPLGYAPEALEPHIDAMTMTIHPNRVHVIFVDKYIHTIKRILVYNKQW